VAQPAKVAPFAGGNEATVRKKGRPGRSHAANQAAKTTLFAAGNAGVVRKKRRQATFFQ
jgi:hypothetical protein